MSNVSDTAELVETSIYQQFEPKIIQSQDGREFMLTPTGGGHWNYTDITAPNTIKPLAPQIITQAVKVQDVTSLMNYVNRFKNDNSVLFADISSSTILGVIDYHTAAVATNEDIANAIDPTARHTKHTVSLQIPKSLEWETWSAIDGKMMSHVDFANFLEENSMDILPLGVLHNAAGEVIEDAPTTIFELCREMQLRSSYGASSVVRNGDYVSVEMQKGDDITTKRNVSMPASIDLNIPVYFGEQPVLITALMRQRASGEGKIQMGIKLRRPEQVRQDEFKRIVSEIEQGVMLATLYGKPA